MKLSIVVTTRNRKEDLLNCLDSILKSTFKDFELIIIDDNSTDGTQDLKKADLDFKNIKIIHSQKQLMMVGARNLGARQAQARYILFVDDDNIFTEEAIKRLVCCADKHPHFGIIGTPIYFYSDRKKRFSRQRFNLLTGMTETAVKSDKDLVESDGAPNVFLIKKEVFGQCGYFDSNLIQTFTEPDFVFKAKGYGYKCGICQKATVYHDIKEESWVLRSLGSIFYQKAYCLMRNRTVLVKRYGKFWQRIIYLVFFSWLWPFLYSLVALRYKRFGLIKLYWYGFKDGVVYLLTGKLKNSLPKLLKTQR